ncbi:heme/hemin ABC transporter substrate-binding protein, partial [Streptomyces caniscabiei]|uniref:heme/hemin ABC transporter substrate-binding protein n=1 Tax=Streptomyces caniscabiei TaxID=2746961 RepID=UPI003AF32BDD
MRRSGRPQLTSIRRGVAALAVAFAMLAAGCAGGDGDGEATGAKSSAPSASERAAAAQKQLRTNSLVPLKGAAPTPEFPVTVDSSDGRKVTVEDASRILPLNGGIAEIVFTLGLGDHVVGRDITATFEEAADLPQVTKAHDVSAESVLSLDPTVVLADTDTGPSEAVDQIRDAGVPVVVLEPADELSDVSTRTTRVAEALGVPAAGEALNERFAGELKAARAAVPEGSRPKVAFLYMRGSAAVYLIGGKGSGADSLIDAADPRMYRNATFGRLPSGTAARAAFNSPAKRSLRASPAAGTPSASATRVVRVLTSESSSAGS